MKIKKAVLRKRYYQVVFFSVAIIIPLFFVSKHQASQIRDLLNVNIELNESLIKTQSENAELKKSQYHLWVMDESCSTQLLNSVDHTLRISVSK